MYRELLCWNEYYEMGKRSKFMRLQCYLENRNSHRASKNMDKT